MKDTGKILFCILSFALCLVTNGSIFAQTGLIPLSEKEKGSFITSLKEKSALVNSLETPFVQEKSLEMFNKKVISKGHFRFKKEDKLEFSYMTPVKYKMTINGNKLKIDNGGKIQIIDLKNNPMVKEMKILIQASFLGKLQDLGNFYEISYYKNSASDIVVDVVPINKSVSDIIRKITVIFNHADMLVTRLRLDEGAQSSTLYYFTDPKINTIKNDEGFNIN
jgi:outer membrane lipoprotein-sorting protein